MNKIQEIVLECLNIIHLGPLVKMSHVSTDVKVLWIVYVFFPAPKNSSIFTIKSLLCWVVGWVNLLCWVVGWVNSSENCKIWPEKLTLLTQWNYDDKGYYPGLHVQLLILQLLRLLEQFQSEKYIFLEFG